MKLQNLQILSLILRRLEVNLDLTRQAAVIQRLHQLTPQSILNLPR